MSLLNFDFKTKNLTYENGVHLGQILKEVDGFYVFYPNGHDGFWEEHVLRALADLLRDLNLPWAKVLATDPVLSGDV